MTRRHRSRHCSGHRVLLADDDADYLEATCLLLEGDGHEVVTADNGEAAVRLAREGRLDLLLLDYFMPVTWAEVAVLPRADA